MAFSYFIFLQVLGSLPFNQLYRDMKKPYRTNLKRLVSFFESSRDKWKSRSHTYQSEKRALQIQVRDLKRSVEHWKNKYKKLEEELKKRFVRKEMIDQ